MGGIREFECRVSSAECRISVTDPEESVLKRAGSFCVGCRGKTTLCAVVGSCFLDILMPYQNLMSLLKPFCILLLSVLSLSCAQTVQTISLLKSDFGDDWVFDLERLKVENAEEDDGVFPGDEPYFIVVGYRSLYNTPNSTQIILNNYKDSDWAKNIETGDSKLIPASMGEIKFDDVNTFEIVGAIIIAMDSDFSGWPNVESTVQSSFVKPLRQALITNIERTPAKPEISKTSNDMRSIWTESFQQESIFKAVLNAIEGVLDPDDMLGVAKISFQHRGQLNTPFPTFNTNNSMVMDYLKPLIFSPHATSDYGPLEFTNTGVGGADDKVHYKVNLSIREQ